MYFSKNKNNTNINKENMKIIKGEKQKMQRLLWMSSIELD